MKSLREYSPRIVIFSQEPTTKSPRNRLILDIHSLQTPPVVLTHCWDAQTRPRVALRLQLHCRYATKLPHHRHLHSALASRLCNAPTSPAIAQTRLLKVYTELWLRVLREGERRPNQGKS